MDYKTINYPVTPQEKGQKTMADSNSVVLASDQVVPVNIANSKGEYCRNEYSVNSVDTSTYYELVAATASAYSAVEIFDSSGQTMVLAFGATGFEIDQFLIFPGGNGRLTFTVPSGSRVTVKAISATASAGEICINFYV